MNLAATSRPFGTTYTRDPQKKLQTYILFIAGFALLIVLWGAFVRISGSGDGCGEHWPLCHGRLLPSRNLATIIEFLHRGSSGLFLILSLALPYFVFKVTPIKHLARRSSIVFGVSVVVEALIGAVLVLAGLVGANTSLVRSFVMAGHLVNTLFLFGSLIITWKLLEYRQPKLERSDLNKSVSILLGFYVLTAVFGAFAALGSHLFPVGSLAEGIQLDFTAGSHALLQLRVLHPILGFGFVFAAAYFLSQRSGMPVYQAKFATTLIVCHSVFGLVTLLSLSPTWMKLVHLGLVELTWMVLIVFLVPIFVKESR